MPTEMPEKYGQLRKGLRIHLTALHKDAREQPVKAEEAGNMAAELKAEARRAKIDLEEAKGHANIDIRRDPDQYGLGKVTESAVQATIPIHPDVVRANREYADACERADKAEALSDAYQHRKSMIQDEVRLVLANYFGEATVKDMDRADRELQDEKREKVEAEFERRRKDQTQAE